MSNTYDVKATLENGANVTATVPQGTPVNEVVAGTVAEHTVSFSTAGADFTVKVAEGTTLADAFAQGAQALGIAPDAIKALAVLVDGEQVDPETTPVTEDVVATAAENTYNG